MIYSKLLGFDSRKLNEKKKTEADREVKTYLNSEILREL